MSNNVGGIAADRLRSFVERYERLQAEIDALKADQKEVMAEAKGTGFDTKTIREIIKLRKMSKEDRDEREALLDIYKAALGMLDGTPLGDAAVRRLTQKPATPKPKPTAEDGQSDIEDFTKPANEPEAEAEPDPEEQLAPGPTVEEARAMGRKAAEDGAPVTANPFPARDPRRAVWDEEWCRASGSDGMDLPSAWRRSTPKKPSKGAEAADAEDKKAA